MTGPMRPELDSISDLGADPLEARRLRTLEANTASNERLASKFPPPESEWWKPKPAIREKMWTAIAAAFCTIAIAIAGWVSARLTPMSPPEPRTVIIERVVEGPPRALEDGGAK